MDGYKAGCKIGGILLKPVFDQMKKEQKIITRQQNSLWNHAAEDVALEKVQDKQPKTFSVQQPFDSIIHQHKFW